MIKYLFIFLFIAITGSALTQNTKVFFSQDTVEQETTELTPAFYKNRYNEEDLLFKIVDNYGNKFDKLYGTRNVRPILHGVAYRGGGNNYYHKTNKRKNQNALPDDGITNLCKEGFSKSIYLYQARFDSTYNEVNCNCIDGDTNKLEYVQLDYFDKDHIYEMLKSVHESALNTEVGPVYLHCWNGWHASGFISAIILKQFCGYNSIDAVNYWDLGTDGANTSPHYNTIRKQIKEFTPYPEFILNDSLGNKICPPMPKMVDKTASHLDIEQLLVVPEAFPIGYNVILYDVAFAPNSTTINNVNQLKEINTLIEILKKYPDLRVEIGGHTDRSGNESKNKSLSTERALFIYNHLINNQISKNQLTYKGYGSSMPAYSNSTKDGRNANRRIEVKILAKKDYGSDKLVNENAYTDNQNIEDLLSFEKGKAYVLTSLIFEPNSTKITDSLNVDLIKTVQFLTNNPNINIEIGGYTDVSGMKEINDSISEERAKSVYLFLVKNDINPTRLTYKGYGPLNPISDNRYKWGRDKNRRIEVKVLNNDD